MTALEIIRKTWEEQSQAPFPHECSGAVPQGVDLIRLDADTAACVAWFLRAPGPLPAERRAALDECVRRLERVLPDLEEPGKTYFERLWRLGCMVQQGNRKRGG